MPKVLRIINRLNLGGPTYNASYLSRYMPSNYETVLISGMKDSSEASSDFIAQSMGLEPVYIDSMYRALNPFKDKKAYDQIAELIRQHKPDIVHTHAAKAGALGRLAAHRAGVPVIIHTFHGHIFHSYFNPLKTRVFLGIERYLSSISTKIVAISNKQKQELGEVFKVAPMDRFAVVPLGFDLARFQENVHEKRKTFREKYFLNDDEIAIGIIGRLVPVKNHGLFLKAIKIVSEKTSKKVRAFIIGDGESREEIESQAKELAIEYCDQNSLEKRNYLTFTSWIKDVDVAMAGLDIIALTSLNEGTPVSLIEAQAATKPIVSTAVGGIEDVVIQGETALLSATENAEDLAYNLLQLTENDPLRKTMGKTGYQHAMAKFHYTRLVDDTDQLYQELLERSK